MVRTIGRPEDRESHLKRADIVQQLKQTKQRVSVALEASDEDDATYGIRSECHIAWSLFMHCDFADYEPSDHSEPSNRKTAPADSTAEAVTPPSRETSSADRISHGSRDDSVDTCHSAF